MISNPHCRAEADHAFYNSIAGPDLQKYFLKHCTEEKGGLVKSRRGFFRVTTPLVGFKALQGYRICSLLFPVGTRIYQSFSYSENDPFSHRNYTLYKLRASKAVPVRISNMYSGESTAYGYSIHDGHFVYKVGDPVSPKNSFSNKQSSCESGIHFYLNLGHALEHAKYQPSTRKS